MYAKVLTFIYLFIYLGFILQFLQAMPCSGPHNNNIKCKFYLTIVWKIIIWYMII